jgi:large subunit ribosomal protein L25
MERVKIQAISRIKVGKETAKKVRFKGDTPAIIYGKGLNIAVQIPSTSLKILNSIHFSQNAIIDLQLQNGTKKDEFAAIIKDIQYHPLSEAVMHIDFIKVSLEEKIKVNVPIVLKGEPKGVKDGGILEQVLWHLVVEALPLDIPEKVEINVSELVIGNSIHAADIKLSDKVRIVTSAQDTVATVVEKKEEIVAEVAAEAAPTGPEVIKEKKEVEEGEEGPEAEGKEDAKAKKEEPKPKEEVKGKEPKGKEAEKGKK